jgi:hypothetical protein
MAEEADKNMQKTTLNERPNKRFQFTPDLKEYIIKSKISDAEKKFFLPTPENLEILFNLNGIKNQIFYDKKIYETFFKNEDEEEILDLTNIQHIQNSKILNSILFFLGAINSENDIYAFDDEDEEDKLRAPIPEENFYENSDNYIQYLQNNLSTLTRDIAFIDFQEVIKSLEEIGIKIIVNENNTLFKQIKDHVMSTPENKIMVLITPSNNFYVKTEKSAINGVNYDLKINNITKLFLNNEFISEFIKKIANHPRCYFGLLSSMIKKNLKTANSGMKTQFYKIYPEKCSLIDQKSHDGEDIGKKGVIPKFYRNLNMIMSHVKNKDKMYCFNETNILIIDSKDYKISDNTRNNTINASVVNEEILRMPQEKKMEEMRKRNKKLIEYVQELLEKCPNDVRDYISLHPFEPFKSPVPNVTSEPSK